MQRLARNSENFHYVFDAAISPALRVELGESFVVETEDAFSGALFEEGVLPVPEQFPELGSTPPRVNPVTGPVYVNGAERGDLLAVTLERIEPAPVGVHAIVEGWEPGVSWRDWELFSGSHKYSVEHVAGSSGTTRDGSIRVASYSGPMMPIVGTIGVAPEYVPESTIWQSPDAGASRTGTRALAFGRKRAPGAPKITGTAPRPRVGALTQAPMASSSASRHEAAGAPPFAQIGRSLSRASLGRALCRSAYRLLHLDQGPPLGRVHH